MRSTKLGATPKRSLSVSSACEGARSNKSGRGTQDIGCQAKHVPPNWRRHPVAHKHITMLRAKPGLLCHPRAGEGPEEPRCYWIPACAGMTRNSSLRQTVILLGILRERRMRAPLARSEYRYSRLLTSPWGYAISSERLGPGWDKFSRAPQVLVAFGRGPAPSTRWRWPARLPGNDYSRSP